MSHRSRHWFVMFLPIFLVILLGAGMVGAQDSPRTDSTGSGFVGAESIPTDVVADSTDVDNSTIRMADGRLRVIVELRAEPAAVTFARAGGQGGGAAASAAAAAQRGIVAGEQAAFLSAAAAAGIDAQVFATYDTVGNGVSVAVTSEQLAALRALPQVLAIYPVFRVFRDTSSSIQQVGAPAAWNGSLGGIYTGDGIVVSIIDSGVDYSHRNNNGSGTWPLVPADRQTLADTGGVFPAGNKVIGGYDYVGDAYNGGNPEASGTPANEVPAPDPDPIDCSTRPADLVPTFGITPGQAPSGHGSHVAGIAAGFGVNGDGSTFNFAGGYASVPFATMRIGPGAAPMADVLAMRVFGCWGLASSDTIAEAIDDSVSGKYGAVADVINMSLGSPFGYGGDDNSQLSFYGGAMANATLAGTLVVASAGNNYDTFFTTGAPGVHPSALNVASAADGGEGGILVNSTLTPARFGIENPPNAVVGPAPFVYLPGNGCARAQYATFPAGHFAVVNWTGACGSTGLMTAATDANLAGGAVPLGILVVNNVPSAFQNLTCGYRGTQPIATRTYVPCVSVQQSLGVFLAANPTATITFDPALIAVAGDLADVISVFSSRGPSRYATSGLKPEITGPGDAITSTGSGLGSGSATLGGTSMSAPTVAGIAALAMQANPSWSAHQIKALLINTANNDVFSISTSGPRVGVQRAGSGRVDVVDALTSKVIAFNDNRPEVASVHFGMPQVTPGAAATTVVKQVRYTNKGATAATYNLTIDTYSNANIATFSVSPSTITVPAFGTVKVDVTLTVTVPVSGTQTANRSDPSMAAVIATTIGNQTRHYLTEETANLVATPTSGATIALRVPLYAAPRAASYMYAVVNPVPYSGEAATEPGFVNLLPLGGTGISDAASGFPQAIISVVTALEYSGSDDVGDIAFPIPSLDIQYAGAASNYNTITPVNADTALIFGLATASEWATPNEAFFIVYVDGNQDGFTGAPDDFEIFNSGVNVSGTTSRADVFLTAACPSAPGAACFFHEFLNQTSASFNTYVLNNNVVTFAAYPYLALNYDNNAATPATTLMPVGGDTKINFYVETISRSIGEVVDVSPVMSFDLANPMFDATVQFGSGIWDDVAGNSVLYIADFSGRTVNLTAVGSLPAALLLHHHNQPNVTATNGQNFRRAEVVYFDVDQTDLLVTKTNSDADGKVLPGEEFTYSITVTNTSGGVQAGVTVTDVLPGSLTFVGASPECTHTGQPLGGTVTCTETLGAGEIASYYIDVRVDPTFVGSIVNTATATSDILETDATDNTATSTILVLPPAPILIAPSGDILDDSPEFSWNDINGAGWYYLALTEGGTEVFAGWFEKVVACSAGVCRANPALDLGPGVYQWAVYAWNEVSLAGPWSAYMNFRVMLSPDVPTPIAPIGDITNTDPDFVWSNVNGADDYHLWVSRTEGPSSGLVFEQYMSADGLCTGATCTFNLPVTHTAGRYTWWIRSASDVSGLSAWSAGTVYDVNVSPATPTPIAPIGSITDTTPTFEWSQVASAQWYYLWISKGPNNILNQWYDGAAICDGTTCEVTPGLVLEAGDYEWFIQSFSNYGGYSMWSAGTDFVVAIAPLPPVQVAPVGAIIQTNPTYTWQRSAGATHYAIWVSSASGYVLDRWYAAADACTGDTCSAFPNVVLSSGVHRWWVQAWNPWGGYSAWTGPLVFNVGGAGGTGSGEVAPIMPVEVAPEELGAQNILPEAPAEGS